MDWILSLIPGGSITAIIAGAVAALGILWRMLANAKKSGRNEVRAEIAEKKAVARKEADKIDQTVAGMTDEEVLKEQAKWSRPKR